MHKSDRVAEARLPERRRELLQAAVAAAMADAAEVPVVQVPHELA